MASCVPAFCNSTPWPLKALTVIFLIHSRSSSFNVTHMHLIIPFLLAFCLIVAIYTYPFMFAKNQHKDFMRHLLSVLLCFFTFSNTMLVVIRVDISVAPLVAWTCVIHLLYHMGQVFKEHPTIFKGSEVARVLTQAVVAFLVINAFLYVPHTGPSAKSLILALAVPELLGSIVFAVFLVI